MESQCDYSVYFPAAPISSVSDYATLPRRNHVYLGETVQFLLVLRFRDGSFGGASAKDLVGSLVAVAGACAAESRQQTHGEQSCSSEDDWDEEPGSAEPQEEEPDTNRTFRPCNLQLNPNSAAREEREPVKSALVLDDQVIFCLTVSLDKLPANTLKAKVIVTVWKQEEEKVEVREHGYLTLLQLRCPTHTFRQDLSTFKAQVSTILKVLPPPSVQCQQMTVCGKHVTVLKVLNCSSKDEVCVRDVKILPNYNSSYLPMMPDGSVLVVDNVCHQSAEVTTASFCRVDSESSRLPSTLSALEEQNFLFQLQLQHRSEEDSCDYIHQYVELVIDLERYYTMKSENLFYVMWLIIACLKGLEVPLVAVLQWCVAALPLTRYISSCYSLPCIRLDRPRLVMTASCPSAVRPLEHFWVKYTLLNDLQDFLAVRLIWNSEASSAHRGGKKESGVGAVICQSPLNNLGQFRKGSTLSFTVAFQILRTGLFELSQHMKLKLQFTASVSTPSLESPMGKSPSPSSPAVRELLGRSHSFSHQQPSRLQHFRSGSVMEQRIPSSPAGAAMGRAPFLPTDHTIISLDKIAKRECKVLVLEAV